MRAAPSAPHTPEDSCGPWQLLAATTEPADFPGGQAPRATPPPLRPQHAQDTGLLTSSAASARRTQAPSVIHALIHSPRGHSARSRISPTTPRAPASRPPSPAPELWDHGSLPPTISIDSQPLPQPAGDPARSGPWQLLPPPVCLGLLKEESDPSCS